MDVGIFAVPPSTTRQLTPLTQVFRAYTLGTSAYLAVQSLPLILTPRIIVSLLASEPRTSTDLESYLSRCLGFALLTLAVICILLTGILPVSSQISAAQEEGSDGTIKDPYAYPTLIATTTYHATSAFYLYTQVAYGFSFGFGVGLIASASLFCLGIWVLLFGSEKGRISKKTGADKRTSNFPFENKESAKEKKKDSKRKSMSSKSR